MIVSSSPTLASLCEGLVSDILDPIPVRGVTADSREVKPGTLYVAVRGQEADGHDYLIDAWKRGAIACVVERDVPPLGSLPLLQVDDTRRALSKLAAGFYQHPSSTLHMTGITGTNGKTTVALFLAQLREMLGKNTGVLSTVGVGRGGHLQPASHTTPGPVELQGHLADMRDQGCEGVVMEVSSHALDQHRVADVDFSTVVFTNLSRDHLDYHGSLEAYFDVKARLFCFPGLNHRIVNLDDPMAAELLRRSQGRGNLLTYGLRPDADLRAVVTSESLSGTEGVLHTDAEAERFFLQTPGTHNVHNLLAAVGVLLAEGFPLRELARLVPRLQAAPGRMELVPSSEGTVFVDYAHTPDAVSHAFACLRPLTRGRLIGVLGCGGDRDRGKRTPMFEAARAHADHLILTADNPRGEVVGDILEEMRGPYPPSESLELIPDRRRAIGQAVSLLGRDDVLLIAGKGHETYQEIGGVRFPFDDREVAREALESKGGNDA